MCLRTELGLGALQRDATDARVVVTRMLRLAIQKLLKSVNVAFVCMELGEASPNHLNRSTAAAAALNGSIREPLMIGALFQGS